MLVCLLGAKSNSFIAACFYLGRDVFTQLILKSSHQVLVILYQIHSFVKTKTTLLE